MKNRTFGTLVATALFLSILPCAAALCIGAAGMTEIVSRVQDHESGAEKVREDAALAALDLEALRGRLALAVYGEQAGVAQEAEERMESILARAQALRKRYGANPKWIDELQSNLGVLSAASGRVLSLACGGELGEAEELLETSALPALTAVEQSLERVRLASDGHSGQYPGDLVKIRGWTLRCVLVLSAAALAAAYISRRWLVGAVVRPMAGMERSFLAYCAGSSFVPVSGGTFREAGALAETVNRAANLSAADAAELSRFLEAAADGETPEKPSLRLRPFAQAGMTAGKFLICEVEELIPAALTSAGAERTQDAAREAQRLHTAVLALAEKAAEQKAVGERLCQTSQKMGELAVRAAKAQPGRDQSDGMRLLAIECMEISCDHKRLSAVLEQLAAQALPAAGAVSASLDGIAGEREAALLDELRRRERSLGIKDAAARTLSAAKASAGASLCGRAAAEALAASAEALAQEAAQFQGAGAALSGRAQRTIRLGPDLSYTILPDRDETKPSGPPQENEKPAE